MQKQVFADIEYALASFPFTILGIDRDSRSEFINWELFHQFDQEKPTFTRSRSDNKKRRYLFEQKNRYFIAQKVGYDTGDEPVLRNRILRTSGG